MIPLELYSTNPVLRDEQKFPMEEFLPIELIRVHTKTDDIPSVTDEQLQLYRQASVESAELYTGWLVSGNKPITEPIDFKITNRALRSGYVIHRLQYPVNDGIVYLYGALSQQLRIRSGTRKIHIPIMAALLDVSSACCRDGKGGGSVALDLMALYRTGFSKWEDLPRGIILGMLKFIAWCVTHPGDELVSIHNKESTSGGVMSGSNNIALASGALELWRQYDPEAI